MRTSPPDGMTNFRRDSLSKNLVCIQLAYKFFRVINSSSISPKICTFNAKAESTPKTTLSESYVTCFGTALSKTSTDNSARYTTRQITYLYKNYLTFCVYNITLSRKCTGLSQFSVFSQSYLSVCFSLVIFVVRSNMTLVV